MSARPLSESVAFGAERSPKWQAIIIYTVPAVVSIKFARPYSFDTDTAGIGEATGFIINAERGYILTNRYIIGPGPFWSHYIFDNYEEYQVYPIVIYFSSLLAEIEVNGDRFYI